MWYRRVAYLVLCGSGVLGFVVEFFRGNPQAAFLSGLVGLLAFETLIFCCKVYRK